MPVPLRSALASAGLGLLRQGRSKPGLWAQRLSDRHRADTDSHTTFDWAPSSARSGLDRHAIVLRRLRRRSGQPMRMSYHTCKLCGGGARLDALSFGSRFLTCWASVAYANALPLGQGEMRRLRDLRRQPGIDAVNKPDHRLAARRRPHPIDRTIVASELSELTLQVAYQGWLIYQRGCWIGEGRSGRNTRRRCNHHNGRADPRRL